MSTVGVWCSERVRNSPGESERARDRYAPARARGRGIISVKMMLGARAAFYWIFPCQIKCILCVINKRFMVY